MALHVMHVFSSSSQFKGAEEGKGGREELAEGAWMELDPEGSDGCTPPHSHSLLLVLGDQFIHFED